MALGEVGRNKEKNRKLEVMLKNVNRGLVNEEENLESLETTQGRRRVEANHSACQSLSAQFSLYDDESFEIC